MQPLARGGLRARRAGPGAARQHARRYRIRQSGRSLPTYVYTTSPEQRDVRLSWTDRAARPGQYMYYVRIQQQDSKMAWASPMWISYEP